MKCKMNAKVIVLLSTYNGERFLDQQLYSLRKQSYPALQVFVRDDGSSDSTPEILYKWEKKYPEWITCNIGKNVGYKKSFMSLLYNAPPADYYAFCDQDDFWKVDKVETAINQLGDTNTVAVYTSNVTYCDENMNASGNSQFFNNNTFLKALIFNQSVGCTMVITNRLREMIMKVDIITIDFDEMQSHDCWMYRLCLALGGKSIFDSESHILYRQHGNNQVGGSANAVSTWVERANKLRKKNRNKKLKMAVELERCYHTMLPDNEKRELDTFCKYKKSIASRIEFASKKELYTTSMFSNVCLWIALVFGAI